MKKKVAFVIIRYGAEVNGGAEAHCRMLAERLVPYYDVEVLTTTVRVFGSPAEDYPEGVSTDHGVTVRRFRPEPVEGDRHKRIEKRCRTARRIRRYLDRLHLLGAISSFRPEWRLGAGKERRYFESQREHTPAMLRFIEEHREEYAAFVFLNFYFSQTVLGCTIAPEKTILIPLAHPDRRLYWAINARMFTRVRHIAFNTEAERRTVRRIFGTSLAPNSLLGTAVTYALTRNTTRAISILMVDFSCALKLSMPLAVLSAMRECGSYHITVKGGKYLEALSKADTIVFDKTGTLTRATPQVVEVVPFSGCNEREVLQLAACLEEHFPHSMANAVVEEAKRRGLSHEEYHSQVQYIVAHGISSMVNGEKTLIGSAHFVFEDEGCTIPAGEQERFDALPTQYSHLYLCLAGQLAAVICIHDPLRAEAKDAIRALHDCGIRKVVMMTGDNRRTAACVAEEVGVDEFHAEVLPEDKADFIRRERAAGHTVIMIGDGVNDSPALSEADAGIAISTGAAIAREISDITITSEDLFQLVTLRRISQSLMDRIHRNYRFIVGFNLGLILLGVVGILPPTTSALLHNASTLGISLKSMTDLLPEPEAAATVPERSGE